MPISFYGTFYDEMIRKAKAEEMMLALAVLDGTILEFSGSPGYFSIPDDAFDMGFSDDFSISMSVSWGVNKNGKPILQMESSNAN